MGHKQVLHIRTKQSEVLRTEKDPAQEHHDHGISPANKARQLLQLFPQPHPFQDQKQSVIKSPENKSGSCAMPHSGKEKHDQKVSVGAKRSFPVPAKGNVHIIPEPGGQGNMPPSPEFFHRAGHVGIIKVLLKLEAEHFPKADCHIGIA